jgi:predicted DNA-binding protein (UPF0251 family)
MELATEESGTLTLGEAQRAFGVSRTKLWRLISKFEIPVVTDLMDERIKRVKASDVNRVLQEAEKVKRGIAA